MGLFSRLFGDGRRERLPERPHEPRRDVASLASPLAVAAVHAMASDEPTPSHLGGRPSGVPALAWPTRRGRPLAFLAQIDLPQLHACLAIDWLPRAGALLFFYDVQKQPWGFDPDDADGWRVVHVARDADAAEMPFPATLDDESRLTRQFLRFRSIRSLPSSDRGSVELLHLNDSESDDYADLQQQTFDGSPHHQVGGFPSNVQSDNMELEAQLVSNGMNCGHARAFDSPRAQALEPGAADWRLLLQIDSDDAAGMMWGDAGMLYFWIREPDAAEGRFDRTWLVLQCY